MKNTALITGASSGIGKELAHIHAEHGGDVVVVARRQEELEIIKKELEEKYKIKVYVIGKDLTKAGAPQEIYNELTSQKITVDILVNNAGFGGQGAFHEREWKKDEAMIHLNIIALSHLCRLYLPDFVKRGHGKILNVSSTASLLPGPLQAVYYATKAFVTSFSNAIAEEVRGTGVTVTNLMPGATATGFAHHADLEKTKLFKHVVSPRLVAEQGYRAMLKGELDCIAGLRTSQKILMKMLPFISKKTQLKMIRDMQEVEK